MTEPTYKFRLAEVADAPAFAKWAAENTDIDPSDLEAGMKKNNPTVVTWVVERDGKVILFAPVFCAMQLAHLGFNPDSRASERMGALNVLLRGASAFAAEFGVREITTMTKNGYPLAKWAEAHGFVPDERQQFKYMVKEQGF
jgi:hypothetical protein